MKINKAFAKLMRLQKQTAIWIVKKQILGKMKAQDYRMKDRTKKDEHKLHHQNKMKRTRENLSELKFNLIGGIINKFYLKWE